MAGENLKAFENLKETAAGSLNDKEKAELNKISSIDFQSQKEKIGGKSFTIDGKAMKLKNIVENLKFDASGSKATLNGNAIAWKSELGAAIQVYAIANNKGIGKMLIDGKIGTESIRGLQGTQTEIKTEKNQGRKSPEKKTSVEKIGIAEIENKSFRKYFTPDSNKKYFEKIGILDTKTGVLKPKNKRKYVDDNRLDFSYSFKGETVKLSIPLKPDANHEIDPKALANQIRDEAVKQEKKIKVDVKQESIVDAVESFDVRQFSKKAQAYLKKKNFVLNNKLDLKDGLFSGTGIAFDAKGDLCFGDAFKISKSQVDSFYVNNSFNATKFKSILSPFLDKKANEYFTASAHDVVSKLNKTTITTSSLPEAEDAVKQANSDIKDIKNLGVSIPTADQRILDSKNRQLQIIKDFKEISTGIEDVLDGLEKESRETMSPVAMKNFRERVARRYQWAVSKKRTYNNKSVYNVYKQMANGENKYQKLVNRIKKINDSVN